MTYKPPVKTNETINALAKIALSKKGEEKYFRVVFTQGKEEQAQTYEVFVKPENAPEYLVDPKTRRMATTEWRIKLLSDKTKIFSAVPSDAIVDVEFYDIAHREGEEPHPFKQTSTYKGNTFDVMKFVWLWKVCGEEFKGVEVAQYLNYNFDVAEDEQGREVVAYSKPKSKYTEELDTVLTSAGVWEYGAIAWVENVLPKLKKRAIRAREEKGVKVKLTLSNGYIVGVKPIAVGWDEEDTDYNPEQPKEPQVSVPVEDVEEEVTEPKTEKDDGINWDDDE